MRAAARRSTFHTVGRCDGVRLGEKVPSLLDVAGSLALGEHPSPQEVGPGREELGIRPCTRRGGVGEVGVRLVVAAEDGGEAAEVMADRALAVGPDGGGPLIGPRAESVEQRSGVPRVSAFDGGVAVRTPCP